jgi:soluble lytic murein transglycosylase
MKKLSKIIIAIVTTLVILVGFYFLFPHVWGEAVYPLDYQAQIKKYSLQWGLRPNFVCAIIYTESRFHKDSVSGVGAIGLMQIMPSTGASIAQELGESGYSPDKLYDPETNIRYGTWYIKGLIDKYNGNTELATAAYNAGVGRADKWKDGVQPLPYETVFFVQKIKDTEGMYDKIYGNWALNPEVKRPNPFYQDASNIRDFVKNLILGK